MSNQNVTLYLIVLFIQINTCSVQTTGGNDDSLNLLYNNM